MTPTQRANCYAALERLEKAAQERNITKLYLAMAKAARALREALPNPDQPDIWPEMLPPNYRGRNNS